MQSDGNIEPFIQQLEHYDARDIQRYKESIELSDDISVKTLKSGMFSRMKEETIKKKIEVFLKPQKTKSHGRPIFRDEARDCGLKILDADTSGERWDTAYELYTRTNSLVSTRSAKCIESADSSFSASPPAWE